MFRKDVVLEALGRLRRDPQGRRHRVRRAHRHASSGRRRTSTSPKCWCSPSSPRGRCRATSSRFGWHHGARVAYGQACRYWHREIAAGRESARSSSPAARAASRPQRVPHRPRCPADRVRRPVGVRLAGRARALRRRQRAVEAIASRRTVDDGGAGHRRPALRSRPRSRSATTSCGSQADGRTRFAVWAEPTHARLLIVTDPEILALTRPPETVALTADRLVVVAGHPPPAPSGDWWTYDPAVGRAQRQAHVRRRAAWLPAHDGIADELRACGAAGEILPPQQLRAVPTVRPRPYSGLRGGSRLIVGTTALELPRRDRLSWASLRRLLPRTTPTTSGYGPIPRSSTRC